ncbi:hypothetical protein [Merismopedia glauca]|uniref:hypothetical protein n=1 Tax=Merismopedia glauca TaxID=292586 RepID=UPI0011B230D9|nr:hypothetical protein [Merismopedia glauca]
MFSDRLDKHISLPHNFWRGEIDPDFFDYADNLDLFADDGTFSPSTISFTGYFHQHQVLGEDGLKAAREIRIYRTSDFCTDVAVLRLYE